MLRSPTARTETRAPVHLQKAIERASRSTNPFEPLPAFSVYSVGDEVFELFCKTKAFMDARILKWAFKLAEKNVGPLYKETSMGWQPKVKQTDLNKSWARYLVAVDKTKTPVAYAMFRFDMDYGNAVLYCYELQIEETAQRKRLGSFMMTALENCAIHWGMEKVVLTVLKNNVGAVQFFNKIGFTIDETSPSPNEMADYAIMSKVLF